MKKMTREYAELSLRAGFIAGAIDNALGTIAFEVATRAEIWNLSEEYLESMKCLAIKLGCPQQVIQAAEELVSAQLQDEEFMAKVMEEQERRDAEYAKRRSSTPADAGTGSGDGAGTTVVVAVSQGRPTEDD